MRNSPSLSTEGPAPVADSPFGHVLVGIDDTPESLVAAVQAGVLLAPEGRLVLVGVAERYLASHAGLLGAEAGKQVASITTSELELAQRLVAADESIVLSGRLVPVLHHECARRGATLIAIGTRPHRRLPALVFGGHEVEALRHGSCSVLVARPGWGPRPPARILVGVDGSPGSRAAEDVAHTLGARLQREVVPVMGLEDAAELAALRTGRDDAVIDPGGLHEAVAGAATRESVVVVARTARSVDQVVFGVPCSVLVVDDRAPAAP